MSQNLQTFVKFQKFQLQNLVDFEKCCKTRICLQRSVPIQPKMSEQLPKIWQLPYGSRIVAKPAAALLFRRREAKVEEGPQDGLPMGRSPPGCASAESLRVDRRSASRHAELNASCL